MAITRLGGANAISGTIPQGNIANSSLGAITALPAADGSSLTGIPTDAVQVASASGGGTTVQDFNSCFSSTYQHYMILASISMSSDSTVSMRFQNLSNTELSSGVYYFQGYRTLNNAGSFSHSTSGSFGATSFGPQLVIQAASNRIAGFRIFVYDPYTSSTKTTYDFQYNCQQANSNLNAVNAGGVFDTATGMAGFRFNSDAGNFNSVSKFRIYGLK